MLVDIPSYEADGDRDREMFPKSEAGKQVTEAEYWENYYEPGIYNYEWNNGILEEKPVGDTEGYEIYQWLVFLLKEFFKTFPIGKMVGLEMAFRLKQGQRQGSIRKPDLGVVHIDNPVTLKGPDQSYHGIFDLCIESVSHSSKKTIEHDTIVKKDEYAHVGVREYYILDSWEMETSFLRLIDDGSYEPIPLKDKDILQSGVLPGFAFRVNYLKTRPELEQLIDDPVYSPYVGLALQAERKAKDEALLREKKAVKKQRRLEALLRKAGIDPENSQID